MTVKAEASVIVASCSSDSQSSPLSMDGDTALLQLSALYSAGELVRCLSLSHSHSLSHTHTLSLSLSHTHSPLSLCHDGCHGGVVK